MKPSSSNSDDSLVKASADRWWIARNRTKEGPFSWGELLEKVASGAIAPADMLLRQGESKWSAAFSIPGLIPPVTLPQRKAASPQAADTLSGTCESSEASSDKQPRTVTFRPEPATSAKPKLGWLVIASYRILGELGHGGMGVVYKAQDLQLKRVVALKMISAGQLAHADDHARFRREAEAVARLQHANIVQIHEIGEHEGRPFFILEYVSGGTLAQKIGATPQPVREAAAMVETLSRAIHVAHQQGIVHRDLKPGNILLTNEGSPKIADFGLAKQLGDDDGRTRTGAIVGTPSYMAPEQAAGNAAIGPACDIHALGAILYQMLTGRPPFKGETVMETLDLVRNREPAAPSRLQPKVPHDLETICLKCLQKAPGNRYDSAASLADDLKRFLDHEPIQARPVGRVERVWRWYQRNRRLAVASGLAACFLLAATIVSTFSWIREKKNAEDLARSAVKLDAEKTVAKDALSKAEREEKEASRRNAMLAFEKGLTLTAPRESQPYHALIQFGQALQHAEKSGDRDLEAMIRANIAEWSCMAHKLRTVFRPLPQCKNIFALFAQDGRSIHVLSGSTHQPGWFATYDASGKTTVGPQKAENHEFLTVSRNGHFAACRHLDSIMAWDMAKGTKIHRPVGFRREAGVSKVAVSDDGKRVLTLEEGDLFCWDLETGKNLFELSASKDCRFEFIPGRSDFLTLNHGNLDVWSAEGQHIEFGAKEVPFANPNVPNGAPARTDFDSFALSPDGKLLLVAPSNSSHQYYVFDYPSGKSHGARSIRTLIGNAKVNAFHLGRDAQLILSATDLREIAVGNKDGSTYAPLLEHVRPIVSMQLSPDNRRLLSVDDEGVVRVYELSLDAISYSYYAAKVLDERKRINLIRRDDESLRAIPHPKENLVAVGASGEVQLRDMETLEVKKRLTAVALGLPQKGFHQVTAVEFDSTGRYLGSSWGDGTVRVWDLETDRLIVPKGDPIRVDSYTSGKAPFAFLPHSTELLIFWRSGAGQRVDFVTGNAAPVDFLTVNDIPAQPVDTDASMEFVPVSLVMQKEPVRNFGIAPDGSKFANLQCFAVLPDGRRFLAGFETGEVVLRDLAAKTSKVVHRHTESVTAFAVSADGKWWASGGKDGATCLLNSSGDVRSLFTRGTKVVDPISCLAFSRDGAFLASGTSNYQLVRKWHTRTGQPVGPQLTLPQPIGVSGQILSVAFTADGRRLLATTDSKHPFHSWSIPTPPRETAEAVQRRIALSSGLVVTQEGEAIRRATFDELKSFLDDRHSAADDADQLAWHANFSRKDTLVLADYWAQRGSWAYANLFYDMHLAENPKDAVALAHRGFLANYAGDTARAVADWTVALELDPEMAWEEDASFKPMLLNRGIANSTLGKHELAVEDLDRLLAKTGNGRDWALLYRGMSLGHLSLANNNPSLLDRGLKDLDQSIEKSGAPQVPPTPGQAPPMPGQCVSPQVWFLRCNRSSLYLWKKDYDKAIADATIGLSHLNAPPPDN